MIIQPTEKLIQCDKCGKLATVLWALENNWTYSQGGHHCADCQPKEIAM